MQPRDRARLALIRATEQALDRYPERTVAVVRARLEKASRRGDGEPLESRNVVAWLAVRAIDVHPAVGERLVRVWLSRAAERHRALQQSAKRRAASRAGGSAGDEGRDQARLTWSSSILRSARAITWRARLVASGFTEMDVMPWRTRSSANSGRFDGA